MTTRILTIPGLADEQRAAHERMYGDPDWTASKERLVRFYDGDPLWAALAVLSDVQELLDGPHDGITARHYVSKAKNLINDAMHTRKERPHERDHFVKAMSDLEAAVEYRVGTVSRDKSAENAARLRLLALYDRNKP